MSATAARCRATGCRSTARVCSTCSTPRSRRCVSPTRKIETPPQRTRTPMNESAEGLPAPAAHGSFARLRWIVPAAFLAMVAWLLWREVGEFPLPDIQKTLLDVPTASALGVAALAVFSVTFTGLVDWLIGRWLKLGLHARDYLRLAFIANGMANTLNLSGAMGASVRLMGLSSHKVPLSRAAALIGMQALSLLSGLSLLVIVTLATSSLPMSSGTPQHWIAGIVLALAALYLPLYFF